MPPSVWAHCTYCCLWKRPHSKIKTVRSKLSSIASPLHRPAFNRMEFTFNGTRRPTPHGASRLMKATSLWSGQTRRGPSRHWRDARVYGRTTTATHDIRAPPPPPPPPPPSSLGLKNGCGVFGFFAVLPWLNPPPPSLFCLLRTQFHVG